ncbi:Ger(x)C family spore germination protein [Rossellomorea aquimaris]|uniref:Ger(x)C family spore germination protein n=1 Tax=Rossellomorea aquimaris TaxID=189382 RepID=UPI001CD6CAAB|nr:Ger(x)C family spore germination protein [Rossellomorea aquimaris]MCA1055491.1 Ger(x)C family spore germination protein [Rossellomorea aquimaris]
MKKRSLIGIALISMLLSGCVEREILDDLYIETVKGYDVGDNSKIRGTAMFPIYQPDKTIENMTLSAEASSTREVLEKLSRMSQQPLVRGGLDAVVIGEEFAKKGVIDVADSLQRDASIGARVYLMVTEGTAQEVLKGQYGIRGNGMYISNLLKQNITRRELPETNLHMFLFDYYQEGQTPYLPIIRKVSDNTLQVVGVALFKDDKMIDSIPADDMFFFKVLVDRVSEGSHVVKLHEEEDGNEPNIEASVTSLKSKHDIEVAHEKQPVEVTITITIRGIIKEFTGKKLTSGRITQIEEHMKKDIEEKSLKMLKQFQKDGLDPVGIGQSQKHGVKGFDIKEWEKELYPNVKFIIKPDVRIVEGGTVE